MKPTWYPDARFAACAQIRAEHEVKKTRPVRRVSKSAGVGIYAASAAASASSAAVLRRSLSSRTAQPMCARLCRRIPSDPRQHVRSGQSRAGQHLAPIARARPTRDLFGSVAVFLVVSNRVIQRGQNHGGKQLTRRWPCSKLNAVPSTKSRISSSFYSCSCLFWRGALMTRSDRFGYTLSNISLCDCA